MLLTLSANLLYSSEPSDTAESADSLDTVKPVFHLKMKSRTNWETVGYIPGAILFFPFKYTIRGFSVSVGWVDDTKIAAKIDDYLTSDDLRRQLQPTYNVRTGGGVIYHQNGILISDVERNRLKLTATVGTHTEQMYKATFEDLEFADGMMTTDFLAKYWNLKAEQYFGIGINSAYADERYFTLEQATFRGTLNRHLSKKLNLRFNLSYESTNIFKGGKTTKPSITAYTDDERALIPGLDENVEMATVNFSVKINSKDRPGNPTKGMELDAGLGLSTQIGDNKFGFVKYSVDAVKYLNLFYRRVLAFRIAAEVEYPCIGRYDWEYFHPQKFKIIFPNTAFDNLTSMDGYWGAKIVMSFTDEQLKAIVTEARYPDSKAEKKLLETMIKRRYITGKYWFNRVAPLERFELKTDEDGNVAMHFQDLAVEAGLESEETTSYRYSLRMNGKDIKPATYLGGKTSILLPEQNGSETDKTGSRYGENQLQVKLQIKRTLKDDWGKWVKVYIAEWGSEDEFEIIGVAREG